MATPKGFKIDVSRSIVIGTRKDVEAWPLEHSYREDAPSEFERVEATNYRNVLPTDLGYSSAFGLIEIGRVPNYPNTYQYTVGSNLQEAFKAAPKQEILWIETGSLDRVGVCLGEDGIWLIAPSMTFDEAGKAGLDYSSYVEHWHKVVPKQFDVGVRYLWTTCVIDGVIYAYRQGDEHLYIIGDYTLRDRENATTVVWENEYLQLKIQTAVPTFLNMEGQMGLFKADNRLGFWDSDNAIAWSSALDKLDFKPDVTTFAGITKYSEVTGIITKVVEHGKGFIIYASRSIVHCQALANSPEKWSGQAVITNSGVQFDTQIAVGHPSTIHYAWVDNSMAIIENGSIQFSLPELADRVRENNYLVRLTAPCSRYLYVSFGQEWQGGEYDRRAQVLFDGQGRPFYKVPEYVRPPIDYQVPSPNFWGDLIEGGLAEWPEEEWLEPEDPEEELEPMSKQVLMIPFFSGVTYRTPYNSVRLLKWNKILPEPTTHPMSPIVSAMWDGWSVVRAEEINIGTPENPNYVDSQVSEYIFGGNFEPFLPKDTWDMTVPRDEGVRYIDKAGEEFSLEVFECIQRLQADIAEVQSRFNDAAARLDCLSTFFDKRGGQQGDWPLVLGPLTCTDIEPIDLTARFSTQPAADIEAIETADPIKLANMADRWRAIAARIRLGIKNNDVNDLRALANTVKDLEKPIFDAIRVDRLERLEVQAKLYDEKASKVEQLVEDGKPELVAVEYPVSYDLNAAIDEALRTLELDSLPGVEMLDHGIVTGYLPLDGGIRTIWDGCKMRMQTKVDRMHCFTTRYMYGETVSIDDDSCLEEDQLPDPEHPVYGNRFTMNGTTFGSASYQIRYDWMYESLIGKTPEEVYFLLNDDESPLWVTFFEAEISGWGQEWRTSAGVHYRKTHSVSPFRPCEPSQRNKVWGPIPESPTPEGLPVHFPQNTTQPPPTTLPPIYSGEPQTINPLPDLEFFYPDVGTFKANFQKGTKHPYYPTYEWALVYDQLLKKWGSLNTAHQLVFSAYPVNSNSQILTEVEDRATALSAGIIPVFRTPPPYLWEDRDEWYRLLEEYYYTYSGGILTTHLTPCGLAAEGRDGAIVYTKIGAQRAGHTMFTGISAKLSTRSYETGVSVELGTSLGNLGFDGSPDYSNTPDPGSRVPAYPPYTFSHRWNSIYSSSWRDLEAPARLIGRWGTVTIRGNFNLTGLTLYGKPVGRLRYFRSYQEY